jgi:hypothetical protein
LRNHVLLGNPALEEPIREGIPERKQSTVQEEVGVEYYEFGMLLPLLQERLGIGTDEALRLLCGGYGCTGLGAPLWNG